MKIKTQFFCHSAIRIAAVGLLSITLLGEIGCSKPDASQTSDSRQQKKLPKLKFHRPQNLLAASDRLNELYNAFQSEAPIPEPTKFTVIEVIHGEGASAHSHYHLASSSLSSNSPSDANDNHDHDDHGEMKSTELTHQLEIDAFTELSDVIRWLPKIAAADGLEESDWTNINLRVQALNGSMSSELASATSDSEKRIIFGQHADSVEQLIQLLQTLSQSSTDSKSNDGDQN